MSISIVWSVEDVQKMAEEMKVKVSVSQAKKILLLMKGQHDANVGITWAVVEDAITSYLAAHSKAAYPVAEFD